MSCASSAANAAAPISALSSIAAWRAATLFIFKACASPIALALAASLASFVSSAATCTFRALCSSALADWTSCARLTSLVSFARFCSSSSRRLSASRNFVISASRPFVASSSSASNVANAAAPLCAAPSTSACRASALLNFEECAAATAAPLAASFRSFASSAATCAIRALLSALCESRSLVASLSCASNAANAAAPLSALSSIAAWRAATLFSFAACASLTALALAASFKSFASSSASCSCRALSRSLHSARASTATPRSALRVAPISASASFAVARRAAAFIRFVDCADANSSLRSNSFAPFPRTVASSPRSSTTSRSSVSIVSNASLSWAAVSWRSFARASAAAWAALCALASYLAAVVRFVNRCLSSPVPSLWTAASSLTACDDTRNVASSCASFSARISASARSASMSCMLFDASTWRSSMLVTIAP